MSSVQWIRAAVCAVADVGAAATAAAQEFRATVRGQVVDSSGARMPGATVSVGTCSDEGKSNSQFVINAR